MTGLVARSTIRAEFATLLENALTGSGQPVQAVYSYTVKDFGQAMPVLVVGGGGTERAPLGGHSGSYPNYLLSLWVFVLYAEVDETGKLILDVSDQPVWDEQDSEAMLDAIEAAVRVVIDANQQAASWETIEYAGATSADEITVGDQSYRRELIPLRFRTM